jgi:hypothetical protein
MVKTIPKNGRAILVGRSGKSLFSYLDEVHTVRIFCEKRETTITRTVYRVADASRYKKYADFLTDPALRRAKEDCPGTFCEAIPGFRFAVQRTLFARTLIDPDSIWALVARAACG